MYAQPLVVERTGDRGYRGQQRALVGCSHRRDRMAGSTGHPRRRRHPALRRHRPVVASPAPPSSTRTRASSTWSPSSAMVRIISSSRSISRTAPSCGTAPIDPPGLSATVEQQRGALTLSRGMVYVPFGGMAGDCGAYKGAVVGVPADGSGEAHQLRGAHRAHGSGSGTRHRAYPWTRTATSGWPRATRPTTSTFDYGNAVIRMSPAAGAAGLLRPRATGWPSTRARPGHQHHLLSGASAEREGADHRQEHSEPTCWTPPGWARSGARSPLSSWAPRLSVRR